MQNTTTAAALDQTAIRPYGPGKFATIVDSYVWLVGLDGGTDDDLSLNTTWYGLLVGGSSIFTNSDPLREQLTEAEQELITSSAGVIVSEDSYGFVHVEYFDSRTQLDAAWQELRDEAFAADEYEQGW